MYHAPDPSGRSYGDPARAWGRKWGPATSEYPDLYDFQPYLVVSGKRRHRSRRLEPPDSHLYMPNSAYHARPNPRHMNQFYVQDFYNNRYGGVGMGSDFYPQGQHSLKHQKR